MLNISGPLLDISETSVIKENTYFINNKDEVKSKLINWIDYFKTKLKFYGN